MLQPFEGMKRGGSMVPAGRQSDPFAGMMQRHEQAFAHFDQMASRMFGDDFGFGRMDRVFDDARQMMKKAMSFK